jgi:threonine/homoserine/homoserine lactone efflux protein
MRSQNRRAVSLDLYLAFLGVSLLVICTPGQDTALTIRNTLAGGRRAGIATAVGVAFGQAVWTIATGAGLAVLVAASGPLFAAVRLAGAAYLIYLGARSLLKAARPGGSDAGLPAARGRSLSARAAGLQGFLSNLANAKMVAFFISLLPQFTGPHPRLALLIALGLNFSLMTLAWLTGYAFAVDRVGGLLRRVSVRRAMDGLLGAVLVFLGLRLSKEALAL